MRLKNRFQIDRSRGRYELQNRKWVNREIIPWFHVIIIIERYSSLKC